MVPGTNSVPAVSDEPEITLVTLRFEATDPARLLSVLSKYVVLSRQEPGCRNIDLCQSVTESNRFWVIEKWESPETQRTHFDSDEMIEMAEAAAPLLSVPPDIDLLEGLSAYDLQ